jgi:carbamoyl-phosphate synthase small subunit
VCLNDDVVEGLRLLDRPAFSVQYHPEAAAGPHDAAYLFDRFIELMAETKAAVSPSAGADTASDTKTATESKTEDKK